MGAAEILGLARPRPPGPPAGLTRHPHLALPCGREASEPREVMVTGYALRQEFGVSSRTAARVAVLLLPVVLSYYHVS
jgi:hypothetical protein